MQLICLMDSADLNMDFHEDMSDQILGNLSTAIVLLDDDLTILYTNQAAESLLQVSFAHLKDRCFMDLLSNGFEITDTLRDAIKSNQVYTKRKATLQLPGKENVTVDFTVTPVTDDEQKKLLVEIIPLDRYLRIDRDAAIQEHHEVTRQMVRGFAHEIKNPLGGIRGSAQLLAKELPEESLNEYTNIIIEETDRLTALVDRMLGPTSLPTKSLVNIHEILERTAKLIELESSDALVVTRDYDPSIPEVCIDQELIQQALLNICRNAMQCLDGTPHPTLDLVTRTERQFTISGKRHKVVLTIDICDNGPGIPDDIKDHLFYPMISQRPGGTGLGLTFAQSIVHQHGGLIEFDSKPGTTVFRIIIPLEQS